MEIKNKKIAVTGASGMLGVYFCRSLIKAGAKVIGVVRNPQKAGFLADEGVEFRKADLSDRDSLKQAFEGCAAVVSNAAIYSVTNMNWDANYQANKVGTENVYWAANEAGVKRAIHISTFGIYQFTIFDELTEDSPQLDGASKEGGAYRATKQLSEELAWDMARKYGIDLTSIRPSAVYGARDSNFMPVFYFACKSPFIPMPRVGFPVVYAGDVADAVTASLLKDESVGRAYNTTGDDRDFVEFWEGWNEAAGKGPSVLAIPLGLALRASSDRAKQELGFRNRPYADGLREVFAEEPEKLS